MQLSLIITVFQQATTLRALLACLRRQTYSGAWEVIITDDGSNVDIFSVVTTAVKQGDLDIKYVWQPNRGFRAASARNNAIKLAKGEVLLFLDGDTLVSPTFVSQHLEQHSRDRLLVCGTRRNSTVTDTDDVFHLYRNGRLTLDDDSEARMQCHWAGSAYKWMSLLSCNFSVRNRPEVRFDECFVGWGCEDRELSYRLLSRWKYEIRVSDALQIIHIDSNPPACWNPMRSTTASQHDLWHCLRNLIYLIDLYPAADFSPLFHSLQFFDLDTKTDELRFDARRPRTSPLSLATIREWTSRTQACFQTA